jgi:hypothetical protein
VLERAGKYISLGAVIADVQKGGDARDPGPQLFDQCGRDQVGQKDDDHSGELILDQPGNRLQVDKEFCRQVIESENMGVAIVDPDSLRFHEQSLPEMLWYQYQL